MDQVSIHRLSVETRIGITEEERSTQQTLKVSVDIETDTTAVGTSDAIEDTIDYENIAHAIAELGKTERSTIEKFAEDIAQEVLANHGGEGVRVTVEKFILPDTEAVSVTIHRKRS